MGKGKGKGKTSAWQTKGKRKWMKTAWKKRGKGKGKWKTNKWKAKGKGKGTWDNPWKKKRKSPAPSLPPISIMPTGPMMAPTKSPSHEAITTPTHLPIQGTSSPTGTAATSNTPTTTAPTPVQGTTTSPPSTNVPTTNPTAVPTAFPVSSVEPTTMQPTLLVTPSFLVWCANLAYEL